MGTWGQFKILALGLLLTSHSLAAPLNHQSEIAKAQEWANQAQTTYPIVVVDRDELQFIFLKQRVLGRANRNVREEILANYFKEKYQLDTLSPNDLSNIDDYIVGYSSMAAAMPLRQEISNSNLAYKACLVFPRGPNGNQQTETERTLYMDLPGAYEHSYYQLSSRLSFDQLYLFSIYHETAHCLDPKYIPSSAQNDSAHDTHRAEAFAETLAYFKLLERFTSDMAFSRAQLRALYSQYVGTRLAKEDSQTLAHPKMAFAGSIYFLSPYLIEAEKSLSDQKLASLLNSGDIRGLIAYTVDLVDETSGSSVEFMARATAQRVGFVKAKIIYSDYAENDPNYFQDAYESVLEFEEQLTLWTQNAFNLKIDSIPASSQNPSDKASNAQWDTLCQGLYQKDYAIFIMGLNQVRQSLKAVERMDTESQETFESLENLIQSVDKICWDSLEYALESSARGN